MTLEITGKGKFRVKSKSHPQPYIWQITPCIFKGYLQRLSSFYYDLSISYRMVYCLGNRIIQLKKKPTWANCFKHPQIAHGLLYLIKIFPQLLFLTIGTPIFEKV